MAVDPACLMRKLVLDNHGIPNGEEGRFDRLDAKLGDLNGGLQTKKRSALSWFDEQ